jgi:hypothetical protein
MLHPFDGLIAERFLNCDMRQGCGCRGSMPVLNSRRNPDDIAFPDILSGTVPLLDPTRAPEPLTECRFIRHLVAHSGDVTLPQLKKYCIYLGFPEVMLDITDSHYYDVIGSKVTLMEVEAKKVIEKALRA